MRRALLSLLIATCIFGFTALGVYTDGVFSPGIGEGEGAEETNEDNTESVAEANE